MIIDVMHDSEITAEEVQAIMHGMTKAAKLFPEVIFRFVGSRPCYTGEGTPNWYIKNASLMTSHPGMPPQIEAVSFTQMMSSCSENPTLFVTSKFVNMGNSGEDFISGFTCGGYSIQSVKLYRQKENADACIAGVVDHTLQTIAANTTT